MVWHWRFVVGIAHRAILLFPRQATALSLLACVGIGNALVDVGLFTLIARLAPMRSSPAYSACSRA